MSEASPSGYATDGGFPFQMRALSELFDETRLLVPCSTPASARGEVALAGHNLVVVPLRTLAGQGLRRKIEFIFWTARSSLFLLREMRRVDAVHAPVPGDVGTIGMILAFVLRKPLFVRHCGNWFVQTTVAERFWKWFMEKFAGGRNLMLATGGDAEPPSKRNPNVRWIFSTTLTKQELSVCQPRRLQRPRGRVRLIIACRQDREKGAGLVIESLPFILKHFPQTTLDVVGDGDALAEFKELSARLAISDLVTFHGKVDHATVLRLLKQSDLFCYPTSASEGFPKVVLEALACGLPVVTTRVSVLPQLIGTGCGAVLEEATPEAVAHAACEILSDGERYRACSAQALDTARQYSLERWRDVIGDLLRAAWKPLQSNA